VKVGSVVLTTLEAANPDQYVYEPSGAMLKVFEKSTPPETIGFDTDCPFGRFPGSPSK
jgi:hypothetical protein